MTQSVLVTGAGRGIGLAAARLFLDGGFRVVALDKDFSKFDLQRAERVTFLGFAGNLEPGASAVTCDAHGPTSHSLRARYGLDGTGPLAVGKR